MPLCARSTACNSRRSSPSTGSASNAPAFRRVDSVAAEVAADSNYYYSTWGEADEAPPAGAKPRVVILGSGPNRIGQGIEFDYCCVHAVTTYRELGYEAVMVNCNPRPSRPITTRPTGSTS